MMPLWHHVGTHPCYVLRTDYHTLFTLLLVIIAIKDFFIITYECTFNRITLLLTDNTSVNDYSITKT